MTVVPSFPQCSNPPLRDGIRGLLSLVSPKGFTCGEPRPGEQEQALRQEPGEDTGATRARAGDLPGGSLRAQAPPLAQGVPTLFLDPRRTPASRDRRPSASMGLGHQARFTGSLGLCPGNWKPSRPPRGPRIFPWTTLPRRSPTPAEAECPWKTWGPGDGAGTSSGSAPVGAGRGRRYPRQWMGFPVGTQACSPPGRLRVWLWLKLPHPASRWQPWTQQLQLSKIWAKVPKRGP